ncbi:MAG: MBOAT family protein, partial [Spirochaetota bacterium]|nr:MBOAT family protein [Spirochaetota bacterium]
PEKSSVGLLNFLIYISFFPQLVAGPIVRARTFLPQLKAGYIKAVPNIHLAFSLIFGGLFKKLIISTYLQVHIVDLVLKSPSTHSPIEILLAIYGFSAQIYCDFSGYSDIAIGTALLMGFKFPDNFDSPYRAVNIQDFWRRWHITLSTWLKDYLYIPLGGNRKGKFLTYINLMITMLLGGLWHGASLTFIVWGGFHGIALVVNKIWTNIKHKYNLGFGNGKLIRGVSIFITFHFVSFLWVFFYHKDFSSALDVFSSLINFDVSLTEIDLYVIFAIFIGIGVHFFGDRIRNYYLSLMYSTNYMVHTVANAVLMILLINISPKTVPPFIYFQF